MRRMRDPATEFRAREPDLVADNPEQRHIRWNVDVVPLAVDHNRNHAHSRTANTFAPYCI
jgi:hypothetical protein